MILKITNPCHENWNQMQAAKEGKHCLACNKNVIDFTNFSEEELLNYFSQRTNKVCGRLKPEQLDKVLKKKKESFFQKLILKISLIAPLILLEPSESNAQIKGEVEFLEPENKHDSIFNVSDTLEAETTNFIKGKVIDANTKETLPFANVYLKNTNIGTTTDMDGNFELTIPDSIQNKNLTLVITYIGYQPIERLIADLPAGGIFECIWVAQPHILGGIQIVPLKINEPLIIDKVKVWINPWFD